MVWEVFSSGGPNSFFLTSMRLVLRLSLQIFIMVVDGKVLLQFLVFAGFARLLRIPANVKTAYVGALVGNS